MSKYFICIIAMFLFSLFSNPCCFSFQIESKENIEDDDPNAGLTFESLYREYMERVNNPLVIDSIKVVNNKSIKVSIKLYANDEQPILMPKRLIHFRDGKRFNVYMFNLDIKIEFGSGWKIEKTITHADIKNAFPIGIKDNVRWGRINYVYIRKILEDKIVFDINFLIPLSDIGFCFYLAIDKNGYLTFSDKPPK